MSGIGKQLACGLTCLLLGLIGGCPPPAPQSPSTGIPAFPQKMKIELVADKIAGPTGLVFPDDGTRRGFIVSQPGQVLVLNSDGSVNATPLLDIRSEVVPLSPIYDERGLLSIALHPDFASNGRFFACYVGEKSAEIDSRFNSEVRVSEFRISATDPNVADAASERVILRVGKPQAAHNGGQLAFGPDGYLYISIGDGGSTNDNGFGHNPDIGNGQDLTVLLGKILRIDVNGAEPYEIPADNPFFAFNSARNEIWAYGLRNSWRFSFDANTGRLYAGDVGQDEREEVNIIERGGNYGWRILEGTACHSPTSGGPLDGGDCPTTDVRGNKLIAPIIEYSHDEGEAVVGGAVYRGGEITALIGYYIFADWSRSTTSGAGRLFAAGEAIGGDWSVEEILLQNGDSEGRIGAFITAIATDSLFEMYILTNDSTRPDGSGGAIWRLKRGDR